MAWSTKERAAAIVIVAVVVWLLWKGPGREKRELEIDADVFSRTFGERIRNEVPVDTGTQFGPPKPSDPTLLKLIEESNRAIGEYEVPPNFWGIS